MRYICIHVLSKSKHFSLIGGSDYKLIYRHYATLYFVFCVDSSESELGILDLIQVTVYVIWLYSVLTLFQRVWHPQNYINLYIVYSDRKSYTSSPWGCFQIVNILFRIQDITILRYVRIVNFELIYTNIITGQKMASL